EKATGWNFELRIAAPVSARYLKYHITPKRTLCASELQVLDRSAMRPSTFALRCPQRPPPRTCRNSALDVRARVTRRASPRRGAPPGTADLVPEIHLLRGYCWVTARSKPHRK